MSFLELLRLSWEASGSLLGSLEALLGLFEALLRLSWEASLGGPKMGLTLKELIIVPGYGFNWGREGTAY